jgi:hypothetical protein
MNVFSNKIVIQVEQYKQKMEEYCLQEVEQISLKKYYIKYKKRMLVKIQYNYQDMYHKM